MKKIAICFGGGSPEHEVSIITGLQVVEHIDTSSFSTCIIYVSESGEFFYLPNVANRRDFLHARKNIISFGRDAKGGYIQTSGLVSKKIYLDGAYLAFHGGKGESGSIQGLFDSIGVAYTGQNVLTSSVSMNKQVTKELVKGSGVSVIEGMSLQSDEIQKNQGESVESVIKKIKLPVIVKPVHLGSSIGVSVCSTKVELTKALLAAARIDSEILVEKLIKNFVEYNCAVRSINGVIEVSEIEKPLKKDEILSFADKYQRGSGKKISGMASLVRELPAKIPSTLKNEIEQSAMKVYRAIRATGMFRADFLYSESKLYLIEVNPIPGSMAFYLWEASGVSFTDQITQSIEEALRVYEKQSSFKLEYKTDIVQTFINSTNQ